MGEGMLQDGSWKKTMQEGGFKPINFSSMGAVLPAGQLHGLLKLREHYRKIFFEMGFSEMPTNQFVESSFWNFDSLFQPQQHPARDAHDTFFLKEPAMADESLVPADYLKKVHETHENGGDTGARGGATCGARTKVSRTS